MIEHWFIPNQFVGMFYLMSGDCFERYGHDGSPTKWSDTMQQRDYSDVELYCLVEMEVIGVAHILPDRGTVN